MKKLTQAQREALHHSIRNIQDFPKPGIMFKDITTLCNNPAAFKLLCNHLAHVFSDHEFDFVVGIESRGFIIGSVIAYLLNIGFVPIRKKGKLPGKVLSECYSLEYGSDQIEIHEDAFATVKQPKVLLLDDVLVTGGTAKAAVNLIRRAGGQCEHATFIMTLTTLGGLSVLDEVNVNVYSVLEDA